MLLCCEWQTVQTDRGQSGKTQVVLRSTQVVLLNTHVVLRSTQVVLCTVYLVWSTTVVLFHQQLHVVMNYCEAIPCPCCAAQSSSKSDLLTACLHFAPTNGR
jgi:hypothetical protein